MLESYRRLIVPSTPLVLPPAACVQDLSPTADGKNYYVGSCHQRQCQYARIWRRGSDLALDDIRSHGDLRGHDPGYWLSARFGRSFRILRFLRKGENWTDVNRLPPGTDLPELGATPYLSNTLEFQEKEPRCCPGLKQISRFCFPLRSATVM